MKKIKTNYWVLFLIDVLFSVVHIVNMLIIGDSKDLGLIPLVLGDLLFCLIYLSIHGILTYCVYRSVFYPHLITGAVLLISTIGVFSSTFSNNIFLFGFYLCVFYLISLVFSLLTMCAFKIYNKIKRSKENTPQPASENQ